MFVLARTKQPLHHTLVEALRRPAGSTGRGFRTSARSRHGMIFARTRPSPRSVDIHAAVTSCRPKVPAETRRRPFLDAFSDTRTFGLSRPFAPDFGISGEMPEMRET